ncbi:MarR family winged helix-turn-helix transcriptional regulator [Galactobacter valiniphilus]|uniref:MarR family winged helix-turn-helix transcriptional regulator n=1 Tax=Galactobacter valiniphilus TaxID=2676122 RepID=UPI003735A864
MNENIMEISALLRSLAFAGRGAADEWVRESGLTRQQAFALGYIERFQEQGIIARDLADASGTTPASVTSLLQGLETRGLVERKPSPTDSRVKLILVTEAGAQAVAGFGDDMNAAQAKMYAALSEEELETLLQLLRKLAAAQPEGFGAPGGPGFGGFDGFGGPGFPGGPGFGRRGGRGRGHRGGPGFGPRGGRGFDPGGEPGDDAEDEDGPRGPRGRRGGHGGRGGRGVGGPGFPGDPGDQDGEAREFRGGQRRPGFGGPEAEGGPEFRGRRGYRGGSSRRGPWAR